MSAQRDTVIIRYAGELALRQSARRSRLGEGYHRLCRGIELGLRQRGVSFSLRSEFSHLVLRVDAVEEALEVLAKTFGIASYAQVEEEVVSQREAILEAAPKMIPHVKDKRFAVRARRVGGVDFKTPEIEKAVGELLAPYGKVDLMNPEKIIFVETINERTYLFSEKRSGPRGLPLNPKERCLVLISGGFDSAVAAWKMIKRGVACDYLFCNMGGKFHERQALQVVKVLHDLWSAGRESAFFSVDFLPVIEALRKGFGGSYRQVLLKRVMCRVAEKMAFALGSQAIVTGDSLGQVTSQSLQNLKVIDLATTLPLFRPLLGEDKQEIIALANKVGTGLLSEKVVELCGIGKGQPVINAKYKRVLELERDWPQDLEEEIYRSRMKILLQQVDAASLRQPYLFVDQIYPQAKVMDCQEEQWQRAWSFPGAVLTSFDRLSRDYWTLSKDGVYILYCTFGSKTPYLVEMMQQSGYEAYAFNGGVKALKKICQKRKEKENSF